MSSAHSSKTEASASEAKNYVIGFILAVVLTAIPFGVVMGQFFDTTVTVAIIMAFGAVQMIVHLVYFLHTTWGPYSLSGCLRCNCRRVSG